MVHVVRLHIPGAQGDISGKLGKASLTKELKQVRWVWLRQVVTSHRGNITVVHPERSNKEGMESRLTHMNTITMEKVAIAKSCVRMFRWVIMFIAISSTTTRRTLPCMVEAFGSGSKSPFTTRPTQISKAASSVTLFMGMSRKARRQMQQEQKTKVGRDKKFRDA